METIINFIINLFSGITGSAFGREIVVFIISMLPILELRGGLLASALLKVNPIVGYIVSMIGNIIPVPFILLFINKILNWMEKSKVKWINSLAKWIRKKADKHKGQIEKYGYVGLLLFVGIPLPGTGAWTGCLIASLLNMDKKKSFIYTFFGIVMASIIMMIVSYGIVGNLID
jgi:uncharacterized membrane protein